jgi:transposase
MATIIANPPSVAIVRPTCSRCGGRMWLVRIFPDKPGYDQRTYECPRCDYEITEVVQVKEAV